MKTWFFATVALIGLSACAPRIIDKLPYYKLTVVQGMPLDTNALLSVKPGMSREQVALTLGQPLLRPSFRNDRWDYVYETVKGGKTKENLDFTVYFNAANQVDRIEGNALIEAQKQKGNQ